MDDKVIASNLRRLRGFKKLNQEEIAKKAGISRGAYRNIETGKSVPRVSTLQSIANVLGVKLQDLINPSRQLNAVRFRAKKKMISREQILVEVASWLDNYNFLENLLNDMRSVKYDELVKAAHHAYGESANHERPIKVAMAAREALGRSDREPIWDICGLLETNGVKVYPKILKTDSWFGLSVSPSDGGPAIVVNVWDRISVERWIFSVAHELGHLLLHLGSYDIKKAEEETDQEKEADLFAGHFLMPDSGFVNEWEDTYGLNFIDRVMKVKRIFKVSWKTVIYRLQEIGVLDSSIWMKMSVAFKRRYGVSIDWKSEPEGLTPRAFTDTAPEAKRSKEPENLTSLDFMEDRLSRLVRKAIDDDLISLSRGAEILRLDLGQMRELMNSWIGKVNGKTLEGAKIHS